MDVSGIMRFSNISSNLICSDVVIEDSKRFFQSTQLAWRIAWGVRHKGCWEDDESLLYTNMIHIKYDRMDNYASIC